MRPQDKMMQARPQATAPEVPVEEAPMNPLEMLDGLTVEMIDGMEESDAKGILTQLVSTMQPAPEAPQEAPTM